MSRPCKLRNIGHFPGALYFKPRGIPLSDLTEVELPLDVLEALRLVDFEGLSFEVAGQRMGISRGTIGRLVEKGRKTLVDLVLHGRALRVADGPPYAATSERPACCEAASAQAGHHHFKRGQAARKKRKSNEQ